MMRMKLWCVFMIALTGCGGGNEGPEPIKIGAIFDLTGPTSDVGTIYSEGMRGYVEWLNSEGGIAGRPVELVYQDYGYQVDRAEQLYSQFVQEGVVVFIGWGTGDTEALRGRIANDRIPFMSASYSHGLAEPDVAPYNFLVGTTYSDQFLIILNWIKTNHPRDGTPVVALLHHASPFGLSPYELLGKEFAESHGIELTAYEMPRGATDLTAELIQIRESGARTIVIQNTSGPASLALKNAHSLGMGVDFFCLNWCSNEILIDLAGDASEGVYGSILFAPPSPEIEGFSAARDFLAARGETLDDKGLLYGQGWWTVAIMAEGIRRVAEGGAELTGERIRSAFEAMEGFETGGASMPISFSPDDHRGSKGMRLFRVQDGIWQSATEFLPVIER